MGGTKDDAEENEHLASLLPLPTDFVAKWKFSLFSQPYFSISDVFCCHSTIIQSEILYFILYRFTVEHNLSFWKTKLFSPRKGEKEDGME